MKKLLLLLQSLVWCFVTQGQPAFEKYYIAVGTATMTLSERSDSNLFTGIAYQSGASIIDQTGNIIQTRCYDRIPFTVIQSVRRRTDNEIYFTAGYVHDSCAMGASLEINPVIGKMDSLGNVLALHHYQLNAVSCSNTALDLEITADAGAVAWGRFDSFFVLRVDSAGVPVWSKQFPNRGSIGFIRELPSGDLLAGINMDTAGIVVARLDALGNFLWCRSYIRPKGVANDCLVESDSSFIITGYTDSIMPSAAPEPSTYQPKLFLLKLDGTGSVQWCRGYATTNHWSVPNGSRIVPTLDDKYVVLGNIGTPNGRQPLLMKTDLNGDTVWTRSAGVPGYTHGVVSLMAASDGSFYFDGIAQGDFWQASSAAYLFRTDSLGHLPCSEATPPVIVVSDLFPLDSSFTLNSVDGAVAFTATLADAFYGPIDTIDGCTITSVQDPFRVLNPKVYPNPTTGHFTVQFPDPLTAESYYSVYDAMGRLLYQRPLPKGQQTEEVDLSRFGTGTYVLKFTSPAGVCFERVVLE